LNGHTCQQHGERRRVSKSTLKKDGCSTEGRNDLREHSMKRSIHLYSTSVSVSRTASEISTLLAEARATAILSEFNDGVIKAISFRIKTEFGVLTFRLPANVDGVFAVLQRSRSIPPRLRSREQAGRVAWRITLNWLEAQLALVQAGLATLDQVFLPYCQDPTGVTLYERMRQAKFSGLLLEDGESNTRG
jgi:hypothetical protein